MSAPRLDNRMIAEGLAPSDAALLDSPSIVTCAAAYASLFDLGIRGAAITGGSPFAALHADAVCLRPGARFEFARDMCDASGYVLAVLIPAIDENGETIDIAAWVPKTGALATWSGAASILGEDQINQPRIEIDGLRVFPGVAEWLRADRRGVVILDAERARWRLAEDRLIVGEAAFGRRLREALRLPEPKVFVENARRVAA